MFCKITVTHGVITRETTVQVTFFIHIKTKVTIHIYLNPAHAEEDIPSISGPKGQLRII